MRPLRTGARALGAVVTGVVLVVGTSGCAGPPTVDPAAQVEATVSPPSVVAGQAEQIRREVAARLEAAGRAEDPELVGQAAVGPAAALELLRLQVDGARPDTAATDPDPAEVVVGPRSDGWPRWFAAVTAAGDGLPVLELYDSRDVRSPYRLWGRLTLLPGAELPAFPDPQVGAVPRADGTGPDAPATAATAPEDGEDGESEDGEGPDGSEPDELSVALAGLAERYASVLADGDASAAAAEFEPDPFVEGVRARADAERDAVGGVAETTVTHAPFGDEAVLYAVEGSEGDVLAVTAVETVTTMSVRPGAGVLQPGAEVGEVAGIESTDGTLTTRSVAALAFVVPAERGAIRLVAVGEGLVAAEAS